MQKIKITSLLSLFLTLSGYVPACGQGMTKHIHSREQLWIGYFNQTRFSNKFGLWLDVHYRRTENFGDLPFQFLVRSALQYFVKDNVRAAAGYVFAQHFPSRGFNTIRAEHRPWQQIWWNQKYTRLTTTQALRTEQRFNEKVIDDVKRSGFNYVFRVRYNFSFLMPLNGKELQPETYFVALSNEVFLNFGDDVTYNTFDQNRLSVGLGYQFTANLNVQLSYMNVYQQESAGSNYVSTHAIRLYVLHSLDLRADEK